MLAAESKRAPVRAADRDHLDGLLARTATGDHAAFRALYGHSAGRLFAVCLRIARDRSLAEDLLQEVYLRIWERARQFDPARGSALAWMIAIARNHAIDAIRARIREAIVPDEHAIDVADAGALRGMEARIELPAVTRYLAALDEGPRRAIVLAYRDGLSYDELSALMGIPVGTAKTWVSRGLARIRHCLDEAE